MRTPASGLLVHEPRGLRQLWRLNRRQQLLDERLVNGVSERRPHEIEQDAQALKPMQEIRRSKTTGDVLDQLHRQRLLAGMGQLACTGLVHQEQGVVVLAESGWANIAHQEGHALAKALGRGMVQQVMAFGSKTHAEQFARHATR